MKSQLHNKWMQQIGIEFRHIWVGTVIHWELCKQRKFENTNQENIFKMIWDDYFLNEHNIYAHVMQADSSLRNI